MAKQVEELEVWKRATGFWKGVDGLLSRPAFDRDWKLRDQLRDAIDSILSNISEGFQQPTDRGFAKYLFDAKASTAEARQRLWMAAQRKYITGAEYERENEVGDQVARMTAGLIKYLIKSGRRDRGLGSHAVNFGRPERNRSFTSPESSTAPEGHGAQPDRQDQPEQRGRALTDPPRQRSGKGGAS